MVYARLNLNECLPVDAGAVSELQEKIICEFGELLKLTFKGHKPDYSFILEEIGLVDLLTKNLITLEESTFIIQYYLNNKWIIS